MPLTIPSSAVEFIPSPTYCFSDSGGTTPCGVGDSIRVWRDTTGAYSWTQSTAGRFPTLRLVGADYCVRFDGSNDGLLADSALKSYFEYPPGVSWALLWNWNNISNSTSTGIFLRSIQAGGGNTDHWGTFWGSSGPLRNHGRQTGGTIVSNDFGVPRPQIYSINAWDLTADEIWTEVNDSWAVATGATATPSTVTDIVIGSTVAGGSGAGMDLYSLVLGPTTWNNTERDNVRSFFKSFDFYQAGEYKPVGTPTSVFTAGDDSIHTYRIPAICKYGSTLVAVCEARVSGSGDSGNIDLVCKRSTDGGASWSSLSTIYSNGSNEARNPVLIPDHARGKVHLVFSLGRDSSGNGTMHTVSTDGGATWAEPTDITSSANDAGWTFGATGPGQGALMADGRLVVGCDHRDPSYSGSLRGHVIYSDDEGETWSRTDVIGSNGHDEASITRTGDDSLLMIARNGAGALGGKLKSTSTDNGETWTTPAIDRRLIGNACEGCVLYHAGSGLTLYASITNPLRRCLTVSASPDGGASWTHATVIEAGPAAYNCLVDLGDGTVGCLYEWGNSPNTYGGIKFVVLGEPTISGSHLTFLGSDLSGGLQTLGL